MIKKNLYIVVSMLLVFTTTTSIWSHFLADDGDAIEVSSETESEKGEKELKETEKELDRLDKDSLGSSPFEIVLELIYGLQKVGSSTFAQFDENHLGFYILYSSLKIAC